MSESMVREAAPLSARDLLHAADDAQRTMRLAEVHLLEVAAQWAALHPAALDGHDAAVFFDPHGRYDEPIVRTGCPSIREDSVDEFAAALGMSSDAGKRLIGAALQLQHRLPTIWARVRSGAVDVWRARMVADATIHHFPESHAAQASAWVDARIAPLLGKVGATKIKKVVEAAMLHFDLLATTDDPDHPAHDPTHVAIDLGTLSQHGTVLLHAELRLADALDLHHALTSGAAALLTAGEDDQPPLGLDARRALALGELARRSSGQAVARRMDLHLHFSADALPEQHGVQVTPVGGLENGNQVVLLDWVTRWAKDSFTEVRVLPVLDLNAEIHATGYVPGPLLRRQITLRDSTCVFPWCTRNARTGDLDHIEPFDADRPATEQTRTRNLAALCRRHHRRKTHTAWRYRRVTPGVYEWTSPLGLRYLRGPFGTRQVESPESCR